MPYLAYAGLIALFLLLVAWVPDPKGSGDLWRGYGLTVLGTVAALFGGRWLMILAGYPALAHLEFIGALLIGAFLALCALFRFRFYWQLLELVWPWSAFTDTARRVVIGALGIALIWFATQDGRKLIAAYDYCAGEAALASGAGNGGAIPDPTLVPMRRRFNPPEPAMTCEKVLSP